MNLLAVAYEAVTIDFDSRKRGIKEVSACACGAEDPLLENKPCRRRQGKAVMQHICISYSKVCMVGIA